MKSGKSAKVYQFPTTTRKKIVCQYSSDTTTERSPSPKVNDKTDIELRLLGAVIGATLMFGIMYLSALTIYGV
jgi:hypothetical protein